MSEPTNGGYVSVWKAVALALLAVLTTIIASGVATVNYIDSHSPWLADKPHVERRIKVVEDGMRSMDDKLDTILERLPK